MNSPFQTSNTDWNIPGLFPALLNWRQRQDRATQQISEGVKQVGQGVMGGIMGAKNAEQLGGQGTSPAAGAIMGAFMNAGEGTAGTSNVAADGFSTGRTSVDAPTFSNFNGRAQAANVTASDGTAVERLVANAKVSDAMVKTNPEMLPQMGFESAEQYHALSAGDRINATTGYFKAQGAKEMIMRLQDYQAQTDQRKQVQMDDQTAGTFLQNYLTAPLKTTDPDGVERQTSPEERLSLAAGNTPNMSGRIMPKVMDSLAKWQAVSAKTGEDATPSAMTMPDGGVVYYQPHTKNPITVSPMTKANAYQDQIDNGPVYSPDGKMFWGGKGWAPLKNMGYPEGSTVKTINGVNAVVGPTGQILKTIGTQSAGQALAGVLNGGSNGPAAKTLTPDQARQYLQKAGGDKAKARTMATQDGYSF